MQRRFRFFHCLSHRHAQREARCLRMTAAAETPRRLIDPIGRQRPEAALHHIFFLLVQVIGHSNALNVNGIVHDALGFRRIQPILPELLQRCA